MAAVWTSIGLSGSPVRPSPSDAVSCVATSAARRMHLPARSRNRGGLVTMQMHVTACVRLVSVGHPRSVPVFHCPLHRASTYAIFVVMCVSVENNPFHSPLCLDM